MSYNIDTSKVKILDNFVIPIEALYDIKVINSNWLPEKPEIIDTNTNKVRIEMGCGQSIEGILSNKMIHVSKMDLSGDGSGNNMYEVLNKVFPKTTGEFKTTLIWEGGDSVNSLHVKDGIVTETPIDI